MKAILPFSFSILTLVTQHHVVRKPKSHMEGPGVVHLCSHLEASLIPQTCLWLFVVPFDVCMLGRHWWSYVCLVHIFHGRGKTSKGDITGWLLVAVHLLDQ